MTNRRFVAFPRLCSLCACVSVAIGGIAGDPAQAGFAYGHCNPQNPHFSVDGCGGVDPTLPTTIPTVTQTAPNGGPGSAGGPGTLPGGSAAPALAPTLAPQAVPQQVPQAIPQAIPQRVPARVGQAGPPQVPQPVPQPIPQATPQRVPQPVPQPTPQARPQAMPQLVPQARPTAAPPLRPERPPTIGMPAQPVIVGAGPIGSGTTARPSPGTGVMRTPLAATPTAGQIVHNSGNTEPPRSMDHVARRSGRQLAHDIPQFHDPRTGQIWECHASGHGQRRHVDAEGRETFDGELPLGRVVDVLAFEVPARHPRHAGCLISIRRR